MAVLCEAISVVIRASRVLDVFDGLNSFGMIVPNQTLAADNELVRVGFMVPADVEQFVLALEQRGLVYREQGQAKDLVVIDQQKGPACPCDWVEFGNVSLQGNRVAAARLAGITNMQIITPNGWQFAGSLSQTYGYTPNGLGEKSLKYLREENGVHVYLNLMTGKEVFVSRTSIPPSA